MLMGTRPLPPCQGTTSRAHASLSPHNDNLEQQRGRRVSGPPTIVRTGLDQSDFSIAPVPFHHTPIGGCRPLLGGGIVRFAPFADLESSRPSCWPPSRRPSSGLAQSALWEACTGWCRQLPTSRTPPFHDSQWTSLVGAPGKTWTTFHSSYSEKSRSCTSCSRFMSFISQKSSISIQGLPPGFRS